MTGFKVNFNTSRVDALKTLQADVHANIEDKANVGGTKSGKFSDASIYSQMDKKIQLFPRNQKAHRLNLINNIAKVCIKAAGGDSSVEGKLKAVISKSSLLSENTNLKNSITGKEVKKLVDDLVQTYQEVRLGNFLKSAGVKPEPELIKKLMAEDVNSPTQLELLKENEIQELANEVGMPMSDAIKIHDKGKEIAQNKKIAEEQKNQVNLNQNNNNNTQANNNLNTLVDASSQESLTSLSGSNQTMIVRYDSTDSIFLPEPSESIDPDFRGWLESNGFGDSITEMATFGPQDLDTLANLNDNQIRILAHNIERSVSDVELIVEAAKQADVHWN